MDALILDFDGVVVDSEPVHFVCFRQVLADEGLDLTREEYFGTYVGMDDVMCFRHALSRSGRAIDDEYLQELVQRKSSHVRSAYAREVALVPGVLALARWACSSGIPLAICSSSLRQEIELAGRTTGVIDLVTCIVSADDVTHKKPSPEGYLLAMTRLSQAAGRELRAGRSIAIEDSPTGVSAAKAAGLKVVAVCSSFCASDFAQADRVVPSLNDVAPADLEAIAG